MEERTITSTIAKAKELLEQHHLDGWSIKIDKCKARAGLCNFVTKTIHLSGVFIQSANVTDAQVTDVILHEIAHALAGPSVPHHGQEWKRIARSIGCSGDRCVAPFASPKWHYICPCGRVNYQRHKNNRLWASARVCRWCRGKIYVLSANDDKLQKK